MLSLLLFTGLSHSQEFSSGTIPKRLDSMHGFRFGYGYVNVDPDEHEVLRDRWLYVIGYELTQVLDGGSWLDIMFVQNISVVGLNQSIIIPSGNVLLGFEFNDNFQLASGINITPTQEPFHMILAAGWTPKVGDINVPCHISYVPDINNNWRMYLTTGVNW